MSHKDENDARRAGEQPSDPAEGTSEPAHLDLVRVVTERAHLLPPELSRELSAVLSAGDPALRGVALMRALEAHARGAYPAKPKRRSIGECLGDAFEVMRRRATGEEKPIRTPWPGLTAKLEGGWWPALYTLTSATGTGKTQFAIQAAAHAATDLLARAQRDEADPRRVRYVALELGETDLVARVLGHLSGLPWSSFYYGKPIGSAGPDATPEEKESALSLLFGTHQELLERLPLDIEPGDIFGWTWKDLAEIAAEETPPAMVILDYTQLAKAPPGAREELRETIGNVAKVARKLAQKGVAVLALSSTARTNYDRVNGKAPDAAANGKTSKKAPIEPGKNDPEAAEYIDLGKEAGELEFTADVVMALVRDGAVVASPSRESPPNVWIAVAKGRAFPPGWVPLQWNGSAFTEGSGYEVVTAPNPWAKRPTKRAS